MSNTIRPAELSDKKFIISTNHLAYKEMVIKQFGQWDIAFQDKMIEDDWDEGGMEIITTQGTNFGYFAIKESDKALYLNDFAILPNFQNIGIGSWVIEQLMVRAKNTGKLLELGAFHSNFKAIHFYERLGFSRTGATDLHVQFQFKSETA